MVFHTGLAVLCPCRGEGLTKARAVRGETPAVSEAPASAISIEQV